MSFIKKLLRKNAPPAQPEPIEKKVAEGPTPPDLTSHQAPKPQALQSPQSNPKTPPPTVLPQAVKPVRATPVETLQPSPEATPQKISGQAWETVYVFISSTFNDMHAERDTLVKNVFPELREWCEARRLHLVDIDLRWGVTEQDATENKRVVQVCLDRIDQCRPFFLCFLGQRRGWVPAPDDVGEDTLVRFPALSKHLGTCSVTELEILHALIEPLGTGPGQSPVQHAFLFLRQPDSLAQLPVEPAQLCETYTNAGIADPNLKRQADEQLNRWREQLLPSAAQQSLHRYRGDWDEGATTPELAYPLSSPSNRPEIRQRWRRQWQAAGIPVTGDSLVGEPDLLTSAEAFNQRLTRGRLGNFQCEGRTLKEVILQDLQQAISRQYPEHLQMAPDTSLQHELDEQEQYFQAASAGFIARGDDFQALNAYLENGKGKPYLLAAPAGAGKSTLLASWINSLRQSGKEGGWRIFYRFIGASQQSSNVQALLSSLVQEATAGAPKRSGETTQPLENLLLDPARLRETWMKVFAEAIYSTPCVLVLDGLDQLEQGLSDLDWIPPQLPDNIRLVASFQSGTGMADEYYRSLKEGGQVVLQRLPLFESKASRRQIVQQYLSQYLKELDTAQLEQIVNLPGSDNPLYLKIILSELRVFGVFNELTQKIASFGTTPQSAFLGMLQRMEGDAVNTALPPAQAAPILFAFLAHARHGLSETELVEVIGKEFSDQKPRYTPEQVRDAVRLLLRQTRPFLSRRDGRYDFYYQSFREAVLQRYVAAPPEPSTWTRRPAGSWHNALSAFFLAQPTWLDRQHRKPNQRKVHELAYQLAMSGQLIAFSSLLVDFEYVLAALYTAGQQGMIQGVMSDYQLASRLPLSSEQAQGLGLIGRAIDLSLKSLSQQPDLLAGQLLGRLGGLQNRFVDQLLDGAAWWNTQPWLRPRLAAMKTPNTALRNSLVVSSGQLVAFAAAEDGRRAITLSQDGNPQTYSLKAWDVVAGKRLWLRQLPLGSAWHSLAISADASMALCLGESGLLIFELGSGRYLRQVGGFFHAHGPLLVPQNGTAAILTRQEALVVDLVRGEVQRAFPLPVKTQVHAARLTTDGRRLIITCGQPRMAQGEDRRPFTLDDYQAANAHDTLLVIDLEGRTAQRQITDAALADDLALSPDGKWVILGNELGRVEVWNLEAGRLADKVQGLGSQQTLGAIQYLNFNPMGNLGPKRGRGKVVVTPDGKTLIAGFAPGYIKVYALSEEGRLTEAQSMYSLQPFTWLGVISNDFAVTASVPNSLEEWRLSDGKMVMRLLLDDPLHGVTSFSSATPRLLTGDQGNFLRLWEISVEAGTQAIQLNRNDLSQISSLSVGGGGKVLALERTMIIQLRDLDTFNSVGQIPSAPPPMAAMQFSGDGQSIFTVGIDGSLKRWTIEPAQCTTSVKINLASPQANSIVSMEASPDGKTIFCGDQGSNLYRFDLDGERQMVFPETGSFEPGLARRVRDNDLGMQRFLPWGKNAISLGDDGQILAAVSHNPLFDPKRPGQLVEARYCFELYEAETGQLRHRFNGKSLAEKADQERNIKILGLVALKRSHAVLLILAEKSYGAYSVKTGWEEEQVYLLRSFDLATHQLHTVVRRLRRILGVALSPDEHTALLILEGSVAEWIALNDGVTLDCYYGEQEFLCCTFTLDGGSVCLGDMGGGLTVLSLENMNLP